MENKFGKNGQLGPNQVKKPRKAEVNYCPDYPASKTEESLEGERKALLLHVNKKNPQMIKNKMEEPLPIEDRKLLRTYPS